MKTLSVELVGEQAMEDFGRLCAKACSATGVFYLSGRLGAGKTTLCRGFIRGAGSEAPVKSPTFTIVEPYALPNKKKAYHFDLYRFSDPEEFELMGGRDYFDGKALCMIEWPEKGRDWLAKPDVDIKIEYASDRRYISMISCSQHGDSIVTILNEMYKGSFGKQ